MKGEKVEGPGHTVVYLPSEYSSSRQLLKRRSSNLVVSLLAVPISSLGGENKIQNILYDGCRVFKG